MIDLSTKYLGLQLKNPIIIGSSGLTDSVEKIKQLEAHGAAAVVLKSLFEEEIIMEMEEMLHQMTSRHYVYPETYDYMDAEVEEDSVRKYLRLIREAKQAVKIPIIASINCVSAQKWTYLASEIEKAGPDALELNLFILPTDLHHTQQQSQEIVIDILNKIRKEVKIPIALKISYYSASLGLMIKELSEMDVAGLVLFNRFWSPDFDIENFTVESGNILSHPEDIHLPLRWIALMANRVKCDLAATTGIHDATGLIKMLLAGASVVEIVSTIYKNGPEQIEVMIEELQNWMEKHEFRYINDFKGKLSQSTSQDPAVYMRVQFMKHFRHFVNA
jgi:dihydroorotate dehydrogenase (fumarate)